ncbi:MULTISPECIES: transcriptional regulator GcvA [unclassified Brenneria]|uniref:transcriptional regulator GcvA n=1 Tax=unclassified Brenneria TaxID=2634434 RepID=UPI001556CA72|nr:MULTISPECIES: transcriptional regulator GcvA [unclassified Brenneria]MBJ7223480.1 transcriptional regulator GcvA [Brenneria sp. L3-3C-1]MEE3644720.1 transcriptional regulator GcvA [Brenneria sp. L3_3C_1]MEE3652702.1 transcriptional regulator GcvA [Brenneria sp. HEZEL_4_2_4]NPD02660.1 transcriptional regulator GcvA [Brenneria sp. hezel4-2-4]
MRDLPPTATLRAFEVATRHATFTSAAEELFITQSAVSHQLKSLEEMWGLQLFQRGKTLRLTPAGAALAPLVREFFSKLETTLADLREQKGRVRLRVNTTYSFALKWLLPRLPDLARVHPEILVTIESTDSAIRFTSEDADVAIRFGYGNYPALHSEFMFREQLFPVASPALLQRLGTPSDPAELLRYPLLTRDGADLVPKWDTWFKQVGVNTDVLHESVRFADTNMTIEAALLGQGIALARSGHVEKEIREGSLTRLFDITFPSPAAYYFVCPGGTETQPHILKFRNWLLAQSQQAQLGYG